MDIEAVVGTDPNTVKKSSAGPTQKNHLPALAFKIMTDPIRWPPGILPGVFRSLGCRFVCAKRAQRQGKSAFRAL
jgi:hypothetical protein